jgi:Fe2+ or Zn2+ uptake regulation protein
MMGALLDEATEILRSRGGRMTSQRKRILESLELLGSHPSADEIFAFVSQSDPTLNLSTVYRTLRWLEQEGLISARHFHFDEDRRTDRFDAASPIDHHHFICTECKSVIEFDNRLIGEVKNQFSRQTNCWVQSVSVVLYGLCPNCQK